MCLPITPDLLLVSNWDSHIYYMGSGSITFFWIPAFWGNDPSDNGFDEGAHLNYKDVAVESLQDPKVLRVCFKASKTDLFRVGVDTNYTLCPVSAVLVCLDLAQVPSFILKMGHLLQGCCL